MKDIFNKVYDTKLWGVGETVCGEGSTLKSTVFIREQLPKICKNYGIKRLLDGGCGDFNWMKEIVNNFEYYLGIDVVEPHIIKNKNLYNANNIEFKIGDVLNLNLDLYEFDAIIMADVLVHHTFKDILFTLNKISNSNMKYFILTHFTDYKKNLDVDITNWKAWRPLNFTIEPFNMVLPLESISYNQPYNIGNGIINDKTLSLWKN